MKGGETFTLNDVSANRLIDPERRKVIDKHADKAESIILNEMFKPMTGPGKPTLLIRWRKIL